MVYRILEGYNITSRLPYTGHDQPADTLDSKLADHHRVLHPTEGGLSAGFNGVMRIKITITQARIRSCKRSKCCASGSRALWKRPPRR